MIFDKLDARNLCYSVCVSLSTSNVKALADENWNSKEFFILAAKKDKKGVLGLKFKVSETPHLIERELESDEISIFKSLMDRFTKVLHNEHGRVYELKTNSFKTYYKNGN